MSNTVLKRSDIKVEDTWDLTPIFKDEQDFASNLHQLEKDLDQLTVYQDHLTDDAKTLKNGLALLEDLSIRMGKIYIYASLSSDVDTGNSQAQGLVQQSLSLYSKFSQATSFINVKINALDQKTLDRYLEEEKSLQVYDFFFESIRRHKDHTLSAPEEALLAQVSANLRSGSNIFKILNNADLRFKNIEDENHQSVVLSHGRYGKYLESKDRRVRKDAFHSMYASYKEHKNTFAQTLLETVKSHNTLAHIRKFASARQSALFDNNIDERVYDSLIEGVNQKLHHLHDYIQLRKEILQLDDLNMYDLYVPIVDEVDFTISFEEAKDIALKALSVLGDQYIKDLSQAFDQRWIDIYENEGKRSGAYSSGTYGTYPYVLLNWQNTLDNLFTLVHELGHSMHSYYSRTNQPYIYSDYSIFVAEVASTTNENLLTEYLLKTLTDPKQKAYILNHYLDGVKGTIYRQSQFAEFEHMIHQDQQNNIPLTAESLSEKYFALNQKYYGPNMTYDPDIAYEWARIPHFYMDYYVYQYATGFSCARQFTDRILSMGQEAIDPYLNYLKSGSSRFPLDVLKTAGVDMTTNQATLKTLDHFGQQVQALRALLKK